MQISRRYLAEFIGTFTIVFAATGAMIVNDLNGGVITHLGNALTSGLAVMVMIYAVGDISNAHFNPAVSFGFWLAGHISAKQLAGYVASELGGALLASLLWRLITGQHATLGATVPSVPLLSAFGLEVVLTFFLVYVILHVALTSRASNVLAGVAIGGTVALNSIFAGPLTGASMNPARSLAPALFSGQLGTLWLYVLAPLVGAAIAVGAFQLLRKNV